MSILLCAEPGCSNVTFDLAWRKQPPEDQDQDQALLQRAQQMEDECLQQIKNSSPTDSDMVSPMELRTPEFDSRAESRNSSNVMSASDDSRMLEDISTASSIVEAVVESAKSIVAADLLRAEMMMADSNANKLSASQASNENQPVGTDQTETKELPPPPTETNPKTDVEKNEGHSIASAAEVDNIASGEAAASTTEQKSEVGRNSDVEASAVSECGVADSNSNPSSSVTKVILSLSAAPTGLCLLVLYVGCSRLVAPSYSQSVSVHSSFCSSGCHIPVVVLTNCSSIRSVEGYLYIR